MRLQQHSKNSLNLLNNIKHKEIITSYKYLQQLYLHWVTYSFILFSEVPIPHFKGCGMGPLLVLVSRCFMENLVVTCKIGSFLCSLDNLLQKNVFVFFLEIKFQNGAQLKKGYFDLLFTFLVTKEKLQKFLQHISHSHTYMYFAHLLTFFLPYQFWKKYEFVRYGFSLVWVLVLILIRTIFEQSINNKMVSKI